MEKTPKSVRLQIAIFGRTNVGKSSVLNMLAGQEVAITSPVPGTTTDTVEKSMELLPVGPVVFLDTAGIDDGGEIGALRVQRARKIFDRADIVILVVEPCAWGACEEDIATTAKEKNIPLLVLINKTDIASPSPELSAALKQKGLKPVVCCATLKDRRESTLTEIKRRLMQITAGNAGKARAILDGLIKPGQTAILIIPIDKEAPKGRIILPQVQTLRELLDRGALSLTAREHEYTQALTALKNPPALVVCDSQVVDFMVAHTPETIPCTTFSILFARLKGDLSVYAAGAAAITSLRPGDRVAVLEACSHHAIEDDIGRVKLPRWLAQSAGGQLGIDTFSGRDLPADLRDYKLAIQCGGCMLTRTEILNRLSKAASVGIPITNYGVAISACKGVLERVLSPFPEAMAAYRAAQGKPAATNG